MHIVEHIQYLQWVNQTLKSVKLFWTTMPLLLSAHPTHQSGLVNSDDFVFMLLIDRVEGEGLRGSTTSVQPWHPWLWLTALPSCVWGAGPDPLNPVHPRPLLLETHPLATSTYYFYLSQNNSWESHKMCQIMAKREQKRKESLCLRGRTSVITYGSLN